MFFPTHLSYWIFVNKIVRYFGKLKKSVTKGFWLKYTTAENLDNCYVCMCIFHIHT